MGGPAIIHVNGTQWWCQNNVPHREDGPAVVWDHGECNWYLENEYYTFDEWCLKANKSPKEKAFLMLQYL